MISESERNPNRLYATCAKYPKCNYYVWLTPRRVGDRELGNQDTNNSVQSSIDNVDSAMLEARFAKIESMLGWIKMCVAFVMFVVLVLLLKDPQLEAEMMNRLQHVLPPFPFEQLLPFPCVQVSFSVPWSEVELLVRTNTIHYELFRSTGICMISLFVCDTILYNVMKETILKCELRSSKVCALSALSDVQRLGFHEIENGDLGPLTNITASATTSGDIFLAKAIELTSSRVAVVNILPMFSVISRTASLNSSLFELHRFLFLDPDEASDPPSTPPLSEYSMSSLAWGTDGTLPQSTARSLSLHHLLQFPQVFPLETPVLVVLRIVHKGQQALDQQFILCTRPYMIDLGGPLCPLNSSNISAANLSRQALHSSDGSIVVMGSASSIAPRTPIDLNTSRSSKWTSLTFLASPDGAEENNDTHLASPHGADENNDTHLVMKDSCSRSPGEEEEAGKSDERSPEAPQKIMDEAPWNVMGSLLCLHQWMPDITIHEVEYHLSPFWVQIHGVPLEGISTTNTAKVGSQIGESYRKSGRCYTKRSFRIIATNAVVSVMNRKIAPKKERCQSATLTSPGMALILGVPSLRPLPSSMVDESFNANLLERRVTRLYENPLAHASNDKAATEEGTDPNDSALPNTSKRNSLTCKNKHRHSNAQHAERGPLKGDNARVEEQSSSPNAMNIRPPIGLSKEELLTRSDLKQKMIQPGLGPSSIMDLDLQPEDIGLKTPVIIIDVPSPQKKAHSNIDPNPLNLEMALTEAQISQCRQAISIWEPRKIDKTQSNEPSYTVELPSDDDSPIRDSLQPRRNQIAETDENLAVGFLRNLRIKRKRNESLAIADEDAEPGGIQVEELENGKKARVEES
ncbi:kinesin KP1-like isoform X1 [Senna tora]|uniref:Kinesin KP1-like isoform X1 n=1 Tax=Senna tora TaxID=362788 RepID=A0A834SIN1_9FABA|nr:kinesin KP1-like isoform X1 [Senna tora]